jgi:hypothetical protein
MQKNNNTILYGGLAILGVVVLAAAFKKPASTEMIGAENFNEPTPSGNTTAPVVKTIDKNLMLKNGSKGIEVAELQKLLGITADGIFGPGTQTALSKRKGLNQISLNGFASTPDRNLNPLKAGDKIMSNNSKGAQTYKSEMKANGVYYTNWEKDDLIKYGNAIGTIKSMNEAKTVYSVNVNTFLFDKVIFVNAIDVKKY